MQARWLGVIAFAGLLGCSSSAGVDDTVDASDASAPSADGAPATHDDASSGPSPDSSAPVDAGSSSDASSSSDAPVDAPADAPVTCPSPVATDALLAKRQSCTFKAGDRTEATLGLTAAARAAIPLKHIVVIMKENRSFDHIFGGIASVQPEADVAGPSFTNKDSKGVAVTPFHLTTTCVGFDPDHQWNAMHTQVNAGKMDGFVSSAATSTGGDGHFVMGHYEATDLPFYYFLAGTFAIADHYFPSARTGTFPNRDYMLLGTSDGVTATQYVQWPSASLTTIFDELKSAGVTWGVYADDHPLEETLNNPAKNWEKLNTWSPVSKLLDDFKNGTVPNVVFVDGRENVDDEHPTANVQSGEAWTKRIYDAAVASNAWSSTALLLTYDEAGGFADHVPPSESTCLARPQDSAFHELGVRVPLIAISPWARRHYVSHAEKQHTSISRFIEAVFDLPAMTARDANSDGLLDMFDFACAPQPIAAAPASGTGGCGGAAAITLDKTSFASGETITVHFTGGPGNPKDWIAVYPRTAAVQQGSTLWNYCASNTHTAPAQGVTSGTVTLDANSVNNAGAWPLAAGSSWTAYYLVNDGYTSIASVQFDIHN
jgi:phospholipase C